MNAGRTAVRERMRDFHASRTYMNIWKLTQEQFNKLYFRNVSKLIRIFVSSSYNMRAGCRRSVARNNFVWAADSLLIVEHIDGPLSWMAFVVELWSHDISIICWHNGSDTSQWQHSFEEPEFQLRVWLQYLLRVSRAWNAALSFDWLRPGAATATHQALYPNVFATPREDELMRQFRKQYVSINNDKRSYVCLASNDEPCWFFGWRQSHVSPIQNSVHFINSTFDAMHCNVSHPRASAQLCGIQQ